MDITLVPGFNPGPYTGAGNNTYVISGETPTLVDAATGEAAHLRALADALASTRLAVRREGPALHRDGRSALRPRRDEGANLQYSTEEQRRQPGCSASRMQRDLHDGLLSQVLVTHAHPDHADGCDPIAERWPDAVFRKMPWPELDRLQSVECVPVADGDRIPAGDGTLLAVHTPGHAPDHLCFLDEATGTLFSADLVVPGSSVVIPASRGGSLAQYLASLRRVLALAPARMLPAHGLAIDDPAAVLNQHLEHRQRREDQIVAALRAGDRRPDAMVDRLYDGLDPGLKRLAQESVVAHLVKLEEEGRARSDGKEWEPS